MSIGAGRQEAHETAIEAEIDEDSDIQSGESSSEGAADALSTDGDEARNTDLVAVNDEFQAATVNGTSPVHDQTDAIFNAFSSSATSGATGLERTESDAEGEALTEIASGDGSAKMPDALAALSEPDPASLAGRKSFAKSFGRQEFDETAGGDEIDENKDTANLKFANITAGEKLETDEEDKTSVDEAEANDVEEPTSESVSAQESASEDKEDVHEATEETDVATSDPVLDALPAECAPDVPEQLRSSDLRIIAASALENGRAGKKKKKKEAKAEKKKAAKREKPQVAVQAAAEIGISEQLSSIQHSAGENVVREEISLFAGPNSNTYLKAWENFGNSDDAPAKSWSMAAFLFSIAWFSYRKLFKAAMLALIAFAAATVYNPVFGIVVLAACMVCAGLYGKSIYVRHAETVISKEIKKAKGPDQYLRLLVRSGGVSWPMGIFTAALVVVLIAVHGPWL